MKNSTADNVRTRISWLQSIWNGTFMPTLAHQEKLVDMKTFCTLEIKNEFKTISYNTLKNFCTTNSLPEITHTSENLWEHLLSLRANIHTTLIQTKKDEKSERPTPEMKINEAFNQAQLATLAYLEMLRFFKTLVESDSTLNHATKAQITNFLFESSLRFEDIMATPASSPKTWSLIQGGKVDA